MQHVAHVGSGLGMLHQERKQHKKRVRKVTHSIASYNVETMTGRGRKFTDALERRQDEETK